jgi:hypothetical protein
MVAKPSMKLPSSECARFPFTRETGMSTRVRLTDTHCECASTVGDRISHAHAVFSSVSGEGRGELVGLLALLPLALRTPGSFAQREFETDAAQSEAADEGA